MSRSAAVDVAQTSVDEQVGPARIALGQIFVAFLIVGATSVGGGVVAYLRRSLVARRGWLDDSTFVQMLSISEALPGLNGTNIAILAGDRLRGARGAIAAILGICLPGALIMFTVGLAYGLHADRPVVTAMLATIAAAAVGLVFAVTVQLGRNSLKQISDFFFVVSTVFFVHWLHFPILIVLLCVGALAIWWHRPRPDSRESGR